MQIAKKYELVPLGRIVPATRNARTHSDEQVAQIRASFREFGVLSPCLVDENYNLLAGHGRLMAARAENLSEINCVVVEGLTDIQKRAYLIADNKMSLNAGWSEDVLRLELEELQELDFNVELTGFSEAEVAKLLSDGADAADDAPALDAEPERPIITQPGDLWQLGVHRLLCGDATDRTAVERLMDGKKAHLVFTDPPYGVEYTGSYAPGSKQWDMILGDDKQGDDLLATLLIPAFKNLAAFTHDDAAFYIWHASSTRREFEDAMTAAGLIEKQNIIWVKNNFQIGHTDYHWGHEPCIYAQKAGQTARFFGDRANSTVWRATLRTRKGAETTVKGGVVVTDGVGGQIFVCDKAPKGKKIRHIRAKEQDAIRLCGESKTGSAWEISKETDIRHPTQKPVELAIRAIGNSTQAGEIVLDLFGGSGSTLIGAEITGRAAYLTELDPKYCDVIVSRYIERKGGSGAAAHVQRGGKTLSFDEASREADRG